MRTPALTPISTGVLMVIGNSPKPSIGAGEIILTLRERAVPANIRNVSKSIVDLEDLGYVDTKAQVAFQTSTLDFAVPFVTIGLTSNGVKLLDELRVSDSFPFDILCMPGVRGRLARFLFRLTIRLADPASK